MMTIRKYLQNRQKNKLLRSLSADAIATWSIIYVSAYGYVLIEGTINYQLIVLHR